MALRSSHKGTTSCAKFSTRSSHSCALTRLPIALPLAPGNPLLHQSINPFFAVAQRSYNLKKVLLICRRLQQFSKMISPPNHPIPLTH
jgi:hypothetical protein